MWIMKIIALLFFGLITYCIIKSAMEDTKKQQEEQEKAVKEYLEMHEESERLKREWEEYDVKKSLEFIENNDIKFISSSSDSYTFLLNGEKIIDVNKNSTYCIVSDSEYDSKGNKHIAHIPASILLKASHM